MASVDGIGAAPRADERDERRAALLAEYGEVASNFRLLTDIRFKLLALLPIAAAAATAVLSTGGNRSSASEARALALSLFGLLVTAGLATYNDRNDQHYDELVGRAARIERELGLPDGAFANRPGSWFQIFEVPIIERDRHPKITRDLTIRWRIEHRGPIALIYVSSSALWLFSAFVASAQLIAGKDPVPRGLLAALIVPAAALPAVALRIIRSRRDMRDRDMRLCAVRAVEDVCQRGLKGAAGARDFRSTCERLGRVGADKVMARAGFYSNLRRTERRRFMPDGDPEDPSELMAAYFVALITDLPADWIHDCVCQRRQPLPDRRVAADDPCSRITARDSASG